MFFFHDKVQMIKLPKNITIYPLQNYMSKQILLHQCIRNQKAKFVTLYCKKEMILFEMYYVFLYAVTPTKVYKTVEYR